MADIGRPSDYSLELAADICVRLADGESLKGICTDDDMPSRATVFRWLSQHQEFQDMYARAREEQADTLADQLVSISDEVDVVVKHEGEDVRLALDATAVARNRLRLDARKWVAAKLKPRKYGDRVATEVSGPGGGPVETTVTVVERRIVRADNTNR